MNLPLGYSPPIDALEALLVHGDFPRVECPLTHRFTPGLYTREIVMPAGSLITSKIHRTEHQFLISEGDVSVWIEGEGVVRMKAPFHGVTKPGTRRVLYVHEKTRWTTFHATPLTTVDEVEAEIIEPHTPGLPVLSADELAMLNGATA